MKADTRTRTIPVVVLTSSQEEKRHRRKLQAGRQQLRGQAAGFRQVRRSGLRAGLVLGAAQPDAELKSREYTCGAGLGCGKKRKKAQETEKNGDPQGGKRAEGEKPRQRGHQAKHGTGKIARPDRGGFGRRHRVDGARAEKRGSFTFASQRVENQERISQGLEGIQAGPDPGRLSACRDSTPCRRWHCAIKRRRRRRSSSSPARSARRWRSHA